MGVTVFTSKGKIQQHGKCPALELRLFLPDSVQLSLSAFSRLLHFLYTREEVV